MTVFRVQRQKYLSTFWNPSQKSEGRWNSLGTGLIYTAEANSLALLELTCWYGSVSIFRKGWVCASAEFPSKFVTQVESLGELPADWNNFPHSRETRKIGDRWFRSQVSPVLSVPSAVLNLSRNYLLNPRHPDFEKIVFSEPETLSLDPRLIPPT